jgi:hypothetical protein
MVKSDHIVFKTMHNADDKWDVLAHCPGMPQPQYIGRSRPPCWAGSRVDVIIRSVGRLVVKLLTLGVQVGFKPAISSAVRPRQSMIHRVEQRQPRPTYGRASERILPHPAA